MSSRASQVLASVYLAVAETIVVTVGGNTTGDGTTTFTPQAVVAKRGDTVTFNCKFFFHSCRRGLIDIPVTDGNHTATESTFSGPCTPAHDTDATINGFNSGFRNTTPGTPGSILTVPILEQNENHTFWFFDYNTCGEGGVGVINNNESSTETLAGFVVRTFTSCRIDSATSRRLWVSHTHISHILRTNTHFGSTFFPSAMPSALTARILPTPLLALVPALGRLRRPLLRLLFPKAAPLPNAHSRLVPLEWFHCLLRAYLFRIH